ncbi:MAG: hypothetical protein U0353_12370 [Sandaracinus sp.]
MSAPSIRASTSRASFGAAIETSHETSLAPRSHELAELARVASPEALEAPAELLRLGLAQPSAVHAPSASAEATVPALHVLEAVARIAAHLGPLERAVHALPAREADIVRDRLERARVLADCASALAELRRGVLTALRTARPA